MADDNRTGDPDRNDGSCAAELINPLGDEYGTAEVSASGIDRSQLRRNLRLTPTERVEQMVAFVRIVLPLQGAAHRSKR